MAQKPQRTARYWLRLLIITVAAIAITLISVPLLMGASPMWALTHPSCGDNGAKPDLPYQDISIPSHLGQPFRGFFIPGKKDGLIIVPPAYNGGRNGMLPEATLLAKDGFNVILYESRVCAGQKSISLGYLEVDDVKDVLNYIQQNPDKLPIAGMPIALHGFSSAGATSTMATARYPEIAALLAEGGYHDAGEIMGYDSSSLFQQIMILGSRAAYWLTTGYDTNVLSPVDAVKQIPPRPVFLVYGTVEVSLPGARKQLAALRSVDPNTFAQLWEVPESGHGGYLSAVGVEEYERHVLPFYNCALLKQCEAWNVLWQQP